MTGSAPAPDAATAAAYDRLAAEYAARLTGELQGKPFDRAFLDALALELPSGEVLDLGCGPGHVGAYLAARGVAVRGMDLSAAMVAQARRLFPALRFEVGDLRALPVADGALAAVVAFYAIVHLRPDELPAVFREWRRALVPGGLLALAFHVGHEVRHVDELWGVAATLDFRFHDPAQVQAALRDAGLVVRSAHVREPYDAAVEAQTQRCYLVAQRPA